MADANAPVARLAGLFGRWLRSAPWYLIDFCASQAAERDPLRSRELKGAWAGVAVGRLRAGAPGNYGYSLFAISRADLRRLRDLHLDYVRAMQSMIAASSPGQCVGLYCAQLLDLSAADNVLSS